jgi:putative holliday junction resolvase
VSERWIGVDYGRKRVGVAVGDADLSLPLKALDAQPEDTLLKALRKLAEEEHAAGFVIGLPYNMNGTEGPAAAACRAFGARLAAASGLAVEYADERLSSWEAEARLIEGGLRPSQRKDKIHAVAAQLVLEAFFRGRPTTERGE